MLAEGPQSDTEQNAAGSEREGEVWTLDDALSHVGTGCCQWTALGVCGLANAADAVEILSMSLVLPAAEGDLRLSAADKGALSSCVFLGMLIGGIGWAPMGDRIGRRWALVTALLLNATFAALSAAARSVGALVVLRLVAGVGVGGSVPIVFSHLAELVPMRSRGAFLAALAAHWMVGSIYSAGLGWAIIPAAGWRPFLLVASLPAWVGAAGAALLLPESPRFLLVSGRHQDAKQVLQRMATLNGRHLPSHITLMAHGDCSAGHDRAQQTATTAPLGPDPAGGAQASHCACCARPGWAAACCRAANVWAEQLSRLLRPPLRACTVALLVTWVGLCGGWYSTVLLIPEYFHRRGVQDGSLYAETLAIACANLPGNLASLWLVERLGRRLTACVCLAGACVCALAFAAAPATGTWALVAACTFNGISVGGWNSLDVISAELYPTAVRSAGIGLLGATGRLASFCTTLLAGKLMEVALWIPLAVAAAMLAAGSVSIMLLPEPAGQPLADLVQEAPDDLHERGSLLQLGKRHGSDAPLHIHHRVDQQAGGTGAPALELFGVARPALRDGGAGETDRLL